MTKKGFVSLAFYPNRLQVLQLNSARTKLKKLASANMPQGLIVDHKVRDSSSLAGIIKKLWKDFGIREKSVGIVIPEFSTFTKSLSLPKLDIEEMDEAVRWQSHDFLPLKAQDAVMDWKIVREDEKNYHILTTAIQKTLLAGYVDAVSLAGLYPLVVEIPSLSLARIADGQPGGKLIIYRSFGETVLVVAESETIIGSSVVNTDSFEDVIRTASGLLKHYKHTKIERIFIGGLGFNQSIITNLQTKLGKKVFWIQTKVQGIDAQGLQEYLVPISMQLKDPAEPLDEKTINLLPPDWAKQYEDKRTQARIWGLMVIATIAVAGSLLATISARLYLSRQIYLAENAGLSTGSTSGEAVEVSKKVGEINSLLDNVDKIIAASIDPQELINLVNKAGSNSIRLNQYLIDYEVGSVLLRGVASNRQSLIDFKRALELNKDFSLVYIPISSLEAESDLEFEARFVYLPSKKEELIKLNI